MFFWFSVEEKAPLAHPAGAARRSIDPQERRAVRKGAPGFGAAERTLAREHRSGTCPRWVATGGAGGVGGPILLVGFEQVSFFPVFNQRFFLLCIVLRKRNDSVPVAMICALSVIRSKRALHNRGFGKIVVHSENGRFVVTMIAARSVRSEITWNRNSAPMSAGGT